MQQVLIQHADTMSKTKIVIEDLGGTPADIDAEDPPEDATASKQELEMSISIYDGGPRAGAVKDDRA